MLCTHCQNKQTLKISFNRELIYNHTNNFYFLFNRGMIFFLFQLFFLLLILKNLKLYYILKIRLIILKKKTHNIWIIFFLEVINIMIWLLWWSSIINIKNQPEFSLKMMNSKWNDGNILNALNKNCPIF